VTIDLNAFRFRDLHPNIDLGTASDRYAGWIGQIYSKDRYADQISRRPKKVAGTSFVEEVLPVESVEEYFEHFKTLELDFTFYRPLLDEEGTPTQNYHVLRTYARHFRDGDRVIMKVPQAVFAMKLRRGSAMVENETYLDPELFTRRFYEPALELLDPWIDGFIFEQEYQRKQDRPSPTDYAADLRRFFGAIPEDARYHVELRTEVLLSKPVFEVLERQGVGQVLSHWTWLPSLMRQFSKSGRRFLNARRHGIVRLMTPRGMRYEEAYARAHPFNAMVEGMLQPQMVQETAELMSHAVREDARMSVIINNRAGGNAPMIAQRVVERFLAAFSDQGDRG
jgi:uncharacterized protein YecE (DUF72 family)